MYANNETMTLTLRASDVTHTHNAFVLQGYNLHLSTPLFGSNVKHDSERRTQHRIANKKGGANERDAQPATGMSGVKHQPQQCCVAAHRHTWSLSPSAVELYQESRCAWVWA